ncbi:MAG: dihydroneopterin aldolase [Octadecabacter sp.]|jgi:dihydroneopterin aldolase|uniref:Dihydroneopterin aldolase/epimerase domain-containing protein n=1 Tax=Octadecabacter arcticus 238 TaxID=391616 RepID=M9RRE8_9RHOB|nr:dihydroneopterin aldolase [Octadecabacter arcticus]AGI72986.1 hypothetical protein OA238_c29750 [Octadecabacter arcticus 238]
MTTTSSIELKDIILNTNIGTYGPNDPVPDHHVLDLTLQIDTEKVLIPQDGMEHVFDYDPLIANLKALAQTGHRETQEWLMSQIAHLCAQRPAIQTIEIYLRKFPAHQGTGSVGVRLALDKVDFARLRAQP